jgi:hypothetical protein
MANFDLKRLSTEAKVVGGAALLALVALFLPWYGASVGGFSASVSGFSTSYGWLGGLLIVAAGAYVILVQSEVNLPKLPVSTTVAMLGAAILGTVIVALRWLTLPSGHGGSLGFTYSYGPEVGIYLTIIAGAAECAVGVRRFRKSGEKLPWDRSPSARGPQAPGEPPMPPASV